MIRKSRAVLSLVAAAMMTAACSHSGGRVRHIPVEDTPPAVEAGFAANFPGLTISHTDRIKMPDGSFRYELKFRDAVNHYHHKIFLASGQLMGDKSDVELLTTPAPAVVPAK